MGNQPWPQFQNGIRERSTVLFRLSAPFSIWIRFLPSSSRRDCNISVFSIGILKYLPMPNFSMNYHIVKVKDFRLECFCFLLSCKNKLIHLRPVITQQFNSDGLLHKNYLLVFSLMHQLSSLFF